MLGVKRGTVKLEKYNPNWKAEFEKEKSFIKGIFQDTILDIQHIGSTSIPNLISKPLIDIAIKVEDLNFSDKLTNDLISNNYIERVGRLSGEQRVFAKQVETIVTHHLHFIKVGEEDWNKKIKFRNALLNNPILIEEYGLLKENFLLKYKNDRLKYTNSKAEFIQKVLLNYC